MREAAAKLTWLAEGVQKLAARRRRNINEVNRRL